MRSEPAFMRLTEERVFAQALRQRYLELATNAYDRSDFDRSDFYSLRAIMAVEGKLVEPAGGAGGELGTARTRLTHTLANGARIGMPDLAARAQAAYDCWWLESQPGGDSAIAAACAYNTDLAFNDLASVGTGSRLAVAPQQVVVNSQTPSQTIMAGTSRVEVINQPPARTAPAAPPPARSYSNVPPAAAELPVAPLRPAPVGMAYTPPPSVQHSAALARTMQGVEPMESISSRTFVVEPPAPLFGQEAMQSDTVIPTVPIPGAMAPIDLIPENESVAPYESSYGGQYVTIEAEQHASVMLPVYDDPGSEGYGPTIEAPVYSDASSQPPMAMASMMEQSGDVLSSLVSARSAGASDHAVYFGFDSDKITPEGEDVLGDAIEQLKLENRETVSLMGFTDSAGDSRYNQLLAMRRANAVRSFIQQRAGRPVRFEMMPVGEAEAVRDGGDGVSKALNRRVEILFR